MTEGQAGGATIAFEQVEKGFDGRRILDKVSFSVAQGEALCILGRSGTGKSVTLKLMIGQDHVRQDDNQRRDDNAVGSRFAHAVGALVGGVAIKAGDDGDEIAKGRSLESGGKEIGQCDSVEGAL